VFYNLDLPTSKHENCFNQTLFFEYDEGFLILTQYAELWTDTVLPDCEMEDVSTYFPSVVGGTIKQIAFGCNAIWKNSTCYGQHIINLEIENDVIIRFSTNHGETASENYAAYFTMVERDV